jgi:hypothetical protein
MAAMIALFDHLVGVKEIARLQRSGMRPLPGYRSTQGYAAIGQINPL